MKRLCSLLVLLAVAAVARGEPMWDIAALEKPPATWPADEPKAEGVRALYYAGPAYQGRPTRVFAYYAAPPLAAGQRAPAMVLIHGGGGTAFDGWVRLWNARGYAAIAMDLCGCLPVREEGQAKRWRRHADGGPPGWGGLDQLDAPVKNQWTYHAVADVLLAHSLVRSFAEVDPARIGVTGISWGGYLTSIVSGVDQRFRFAAPVYGCGFLGENSAWSGTLARLGDRGQCWLALWDPAVYLKDSTMPMLWVNGTNDFAYPLDSWQKSYRLAKGPRTLCVRLRMPHGHGPGETPPEIHAFADRHLRGGPPLHRVAGQGRDGRTAWATFEGDVRTAELLFTRDTGPWQKRAWQAAPAQIAAGKASAAVPDGATVYYLNLIDAAGRVVSSEHECL